MWTTWLKSLRMQLSMDYYPIIDLVGVYSRTASKAERIVTKMQQHGKPCAACATLEELLGLKPDYLVESASPSAMKALALPAVKKRNFHHHLVYRCFGGHHLL